MAKKTTPEERVKNAIRTEKRWKAGIPLADLGKGPPIEHPARPRWWDHSLDLNNPDDFDKLAGQALRIESEDSDRELLLRTFEAFGFDHDNPPHWRKVISVLADAHFREKKVGAPKLNDGQVFEDFATIKREHPKIKDTDVFLFMAKAFKDRYPSAGAAKKRFERAIEISVEEAIARSFPKAQAQAARAGKRWTRKVADEKRKKIRAEVIEGCLKGALRFKDRRDSCL